MKKPIINFEDLIPRESVFTLSEKPNKVFTLKKFSLASQIWVKREFGNRLEEIFEKIELEPIARITFYLLKDKTEFKDELDFMEAIVTPKDKLGILRSLLETIGISQPIIDDALKSGDSNPNE